MKNYEEIKEIIVNKLGLTSLKAYSEYLNQYWINKKLIEESDIELLSPDNINNNDFWKLSEELFGTNCVANNQGGQYENEKPVLSVSESNRINLGLARMMGMLNYVDMYKQYHLDILEIGAGYGNFKNYIEINTAFDYTGVDVNPKLSDIIKTPLTGLLPDSVKGKNYSIIYSSNVFQHLSSRQRTTYYQDISDLMHDNSVFIFSIVIRGGPKNENSYDGNYYCIHYGQFTMIPTYRDIIEELSTYFLITYECRRSDGVTAFTLGKKPPAKIIVNMPDNQ
jgi:hypothetical protein